VSKQTPGGSVYYGAIALKSLGFKTGVITKLAKEDFFMLQEFSKRDIWYHAADGKYTSGIKNVYLTDDMDRRECSLIGKAEPFCLKDIPEALEARIFHMGAIMKGEIPEELLDYFCKLGDVSVDVQGFLRTVQRDGGIVFQDWEQKRSMLSKVRYLKADHAESEVLTGQNDIRRACMMVASWGVREVMVTHARGVTLFADGNFYEEDFWPRKIEGRTGRGDTCIATYLGMRTKYPPADSILWAAAVTSLKLEHEGPFLGSVEDVRRKIKCR
jgi:sugar/nucleoside kinase (ribokinase family)